MKVGFDTTCNVVVNFNSFVIVICKCYYL